MNSSGSDFNKSLDELLNFAESLKVREKELDQQHKLELEKQKTEYETQLLFEKKQVEQLQEINRLLREKVQREEQTQTVADKKYTELETRYKCTVEELKQIKNQHHEKQTRIEELEKIARILTNDKTKLEKEVQQLKLDNQTLQDQLKETPTTAAPPRVSNEILELVEKAVVENNELKKVLSERDSSIQSLNEQLSKVQGEDPQLVEQRLLQMLAKLKTDFRLMYENQSNFFLEKIDLLKQKQRDNLASLYKH